MKRIILASGSPRRKMLLEWAEINFEVMVSDADESFDPGEAPEQVAMQIASKKNQAIAEKISQQLDQCILIAADTIVVLDGTIIGKPENKEHAIHILKQLSGKTHEVITAVEIRSSDKIEKFYDKTYVSFYALEDHQIEHYVDHYKPFDKAGAYAIQEWIGVTGIQHINGDFYNVMGLPVSRVIQTLKQSFS
ncbi:MAG: Maf family protein [Bacteroidota bacterium]|jgi:septum formation protein